jgi:hypothetical protein
MVASALQSITRFQEGCHLFVKFMSSTLVLKVPSLLFGFKFFSMELHKDYIFGVLNFTPFSIFFLR